MVRLHVLQGEARCAQARDLVDATSVPGNIIGSPRGVSSNERLYSCYVPAAKKGTISAFLGMKRRYSKNAASCPN